MDEKHEQRVCITFCFKLREMPTETYETIQQEFGEQLMSRTQTFGRFARFKTGRMSIKDGERTGRPSMSTTSENIVRFQRFIYEHRRRTLNKVVIENATCQRIMTEEFGIHPIAAKFVPRFVTYLLRTMKTFCQEWL